MIVVTMRMGVSVIQSSAVLLNIKQSTCNNRIDMSPTYPNSKTLCRILDRKKLAIKKLHAMTTVYLYQS